MKRVVVLTDWYEPGYKAGGPIRSCVNLVNRLVDVAEVFVITTNTDYNETEPYVTVSSDEWTSSNKSKVYYISKSRLTFKKMKELLKDVNPDIIYLNSMFSLFFTIIPFIIAKVVLPKCRIVIAPRGMLAEGALSIKSTKKKMFLKVFSFFGSGTVTWHATDYSEALDIKKQFPKAHVVVASNIVEENKSERPDHIDKRAGELRLISIARISPEKNLLFALEVLAEIEKPVHFDIYGSVNDQRYFERCKGLVASMGQHKINFKGAIEPAQIPTVLSKAHYLFMPTLGENFGHVIIESFSAGTPVIISDRTPWLELEVKGVGYDIPLDELSRYKDVLYSLHALENNNYITSVNACYEFADAYRKEKNDINSYRFLFQ
jgi:glycosyltransferase involved in cell wall biosynthesis